jgi:hypothetical protein
MNVDQIICTKCGLDFRTGHVLGKNAKLSPKGMAYLKTIPWLDEARRAYSKELKADRAKENTGKLRSKAPTRRRKRRR